MSETPADKAIRLLGVKRIAYACDLTTGAVYKWQGRVKGTIPSLHQPAVFRLAREMEVNLSAEEIIGVGEAQPA